MGGVRRGRGNEVGTEALGVTDAILGAVFVEINVPGGVDRIHKRQGVDFGKVPNTSFDVGFGWGKGRHSAVVAVK